MAITDRHNLPVAARTERASPAEVALLHETLDARWTKGQPKKLLGDKAYDSDHLDDVLAEKGIEMISPNNLTAWCQLRMDGLSGAIKDAGKKKKRLRG